MQGHVLDPEVARNVMESGWSVGVVVPAKNEAPFIRKVIETIPELVDCIIVVNDGSTDATHEEIKAAKTHAHVIEIKLEGEGVGAAIDAGHRAMLGQFEGPFVSVVMAGDGQMDPSDFGTLIAPVILGQADHVKATASHTMLVQTTCLLTARWPVKSSALLPHLPQANRLKTHNAVTRRLRMKCFVNGIGNDLGKAMGTRIFGSSN